MLRNLLDWRSEWRKIVLLVTHKRYFVGLKPAFGRTLWEFFHTRWKILLYKVRFYPHKVTLNKTIKKSNFQFGWRGPLVVIFDQLSCCWPFWMLAITRITKMITMALPSMIETCNEKWIPLSLDQTCCQSSWMATIARNYENDPKLVHADPTWAQSDLMGFTSHGLHLIQRATEVKFCSHWYLFNFSKSSRM